jgi:hypothetical protein
LWGLANLKSVEEQIGRLETQGRVDIAVLGLKDIWRQNPFLLRGALSFLLGLQLIGQGPPILWKIIFKNFKSPNLHVHHS